MTNYAIVRFIVNITFWVKYKMLSIAHIVGSLEVGGAERFVIDLSCSQRSTGLKPSIVSLGLDSDFLITECRQLALPVFVSNKPKLLKLWDIYNVLRRFDVIHIHTPYAVKFLRWVLPYFTSKVIYTRHGAAPMKAKHWVKLHKSTKPYVNAITFVSQEGADNFQANHHWSDIPHTVIDNGVIIKPVIKKKANNSYLRLGAVGRMIPLKNQLSLLKAIKRLNKRIQDKIEVNFFGDGECLNTLQTYHQANLAHVNVVFHGMVSDRELIYSNIDVLIVTSETEGLSMVIIEAMANKIPVVATNVGGNPKLVVANNTGWLFEYEDDAVLADYIENIFQNKELVKQYGDSAFNYIRVNFSIDTTEKKYAELYES